MLFSIAFRCLPISTRQLFEASSTADYPSLTQLLDFVRSRVAILEVAGELPNKSTLLLPVKSGKSSGPFRKGGSTTGIFRAPD